MEKLNRALQQADKCINEWRKLRIRYKDLQLSYKRVAKKWDEEFDCFDNRSPMTKKQEKVDDELQDIWEQLKDFQIKYCYEGKIKHIHELDFIRIVENTCKSLGIKCKLRYKCNPCSLRNANNYIKRYEKFKVKLFSSGLLSNGL